MMKYVRSNTIVISVNNSIFIGEDYDFSEAEERELSEKLNEIEKDISKDDKIADDMEKMIQQHLNVSPTQLPQSLKYLIVDIPRLHVEYDQVVERMAQELLQLLRAHRTRHGDPQQGCQGYED